jgi:hypothetical protein
MKVLFRTKIKRKTASFKDLKSYLSKETVVDSLIAATIKPCLELGSKATFYNNKLRWFNNFIISIQG